MSIRRLFSRKSHSGQDGDSTRAPSYRSRASTTPTYASHGPASPYVDNIRAWSENLPSIASMSNAEAATIRDTATTSEVDSMISAGLASSASGDSARSRRQFIYYRVYTEDGGVVSKHPIDSVESSLACINANSVPPPHITTSLKRRICSAEGIEDPTRTTLFVSPSSQSPMDDNGHISIFSSTQAGPGSVPEEPVALVVKSRPSDSFVDAASFLPNTPDAERGVARTRTLWRRERNQTKTALNEPKYLYYRNYNEDTEVASRKPVDSGDGSLSRINTNFIPPPHTGNSIKRTICRVEGITDYMNAKLFVNSYSDAPMEGEAPISDLSSSNLIIDATQEDPMALVSQRPRVPVVMPARPGMLPSRTTARPASQLYNNMVLPSIPAYIDKRYKKQFRARVNKPGEGMWLPIRKNEILYTDGVPIDEFDYSYYSAQNAAGKRGRLYTSTGEILKTGRSRPALIPSYAS